MKIIANDYEEKDIIKIIREWTELTQSNFAESIERKERVIQAYEQGESSYSFKTLMKIARVHGIKIVIEKPIEKPM